jgi:hypothetical protein
MITSPVTIFDSDDLPGEQAAGYEVAVAIGAGGKPTHVAILDHESGEMVEAPIEVALAIAKAILEKVRDPDASLH